MEEIHFKNLILAIIIVSLGSLSLSAGTIKGKVSKGKKVINNAVIYVDITGSTSNEHVQMDQKNMTFIPHVLPILAGTTVDFLNSDDVLHNVFTPDGCAENFNLGSWPKGEIRSYTFKNAGCFPVMLCNVHPEMEAYIVVLGSAYFALSSDGIYEIKNVPAGKYNLKIWHEKYKGSDIKVNVPESGEVIKNFILN